MKEVKVEHHHPYQELMFGLKGIQTRKEGKSMNEVLDAIVKKVQELHKISTDEGPKSIKDDAIFHTFGPERHGSVDAQVHQNEHVRKLEGKVLDLEQQLDEIRAMLIKERRQNDVRGKAKHDNLMFDDLIQGTNPSQRSSDLLQSTPHDNLPTLVNEVGSVTESIEAMKLSKRAGSSIANLPTGLDMFEIKTLVKSYFQNMGLENKFQIA
ncbi:hypothetical protein CsSME_00037617 [Camellia sinensis var. sinensis]